MARDPRYDILFEPVKIGPVTAPNRFFQAPHCTGLGSAFPNAQIEYRAVKAEGGWGVVCTQSCEIHYSADHQNRPYDRLWDDGDIPALARMVERVQAHGSLAGIELGHTGIATRNFFSRAPAIGPASLRSTFVQQPTQSKAMDKADIRAFRDWHRKAALRAKEAGFHIIYTYVGHNATVPSHFLSRRYNTRTDEYGGSLENRARLLRDVLEETKEAVGDKCAVALRFAVDELMGEDGLTCEGEGRDVVEMLAEIPDLWDVNISPWTNDSMTARFAEEGFQEPYIAFVKQVTSKPVVGVGRFTSPDTMVSQIRRGILDFIGAARPSIADPFLPRKIFEGRIEDIRECIGCNVCVSAERYGAPIQCTQNPTAGEEWRRKWHPERIEARQSQARFLVVGSGPAGLECALALGRRGYDVALADAARQLGGRVLKESQLPGLATWLRVRDYRTHAIDKLPNVEIYRESQIGADEVFELGFDRVVLATGAKWRRDGVGGSSPFSVPGLENIQTFTPDDVFAGIDVPGPVLIYDDDHYYMASVLAERFRQQGKAVTFVTPLQEVAAWTLYTLEQSKVCASLIKNGVVLHRAKRLAAATQNEASLACVFTGAQERVSFRSIVLVTSRLPDDSLFKALESRSLEFADRRISGIHRIGDCLAPGTIAAAVFSGHEFARNTDRAEVPEVPFRRERIALEATPIS